MDGAGAFSIDYRAARERFRAGALARGFRPESHEVGGPGLTVDVALGGDAGAPSLVVVSSGLHGVEGFLGSAIQAAILEDGAALGPIPRGVGLVLVHALDPFGFDRLRRFDEANVDLNRNFLLDGDSYSGCPPTYRELDRLLNPRTPPGRLDLMMVEAIPAILRHGMGGLRRAIAGGQYEFPLGLFFGGRGPSETMRLVEAHLPRWVGEARSVVHLDVHTGLGEWGRLALLLEDSVPPARVGWLRERFGRDRVEWSGDGIAYPTRGGLGTWCQARFEGRAYDFLCAEFGTYPGPRVLAALRAENRAYHWGEPGSRGSTRASRRLREAFAPGDRRWRSSTVAEGLAVARRAVEVAAGG